MATYTKRGNAYLIRASSGLTVLRQAWFARSMTWKPTPGMSERQIEKELQRQMVLFEEECRGGPSAPGISNSKPLLSNGSTNMPLRSSASARSAITVPLQSAYTMRWGISIWTSSLRVRSRSSFPVCPSLGRMKRTLLRAFIPKSYRNYLSFISSVFAYALRMGVVKENPCPRVVLPERQEREKNIFTIEETQAFLDALDGEPLRYVVFFVLAIFGGYRREELLGFEFRDFNFTTNVVTVERVSLYDPAHRDIHQARQRQHALIVP